MTLNNNKRNERIAMLEECLSTVKSEDRRHPIEERLPYLRSKKTTAAPQSLSLSDRIEVFEDRLTPDNNSRVRARLDHLRPRQISLHKLRKENKQMLQ
jgi:hypothetical protein